MPRILYLSILIIPMLVGCSNHSKNQNWPESTGTIDRIEAVDGDNSSNPTSPKYKISFSFNYKNKTYKMYQTITQGQANLITEGQTLKVKVNPNDKKASSIVLPVPYPDKSGMNWRRMPKSLTTSKSASE